MDAPAITRRRRPFLAPLIVLGLLTLGVLAVLGIGIAAYQSATTTTVVVVGHASRAPGSIADPPLRPEGEQRAERLAQLFGTRSLGRIDAIYMGHALGLKQTASLLAARLGLQPVELTEEDADSMATRALNEHRGGAVLILARDSNVAPLVQALSGLELPSPHEGDAQLFVVSVPTFGPAGLLRLTY